MLVVVVMPLLRRSASPDVVRTMARSAGKRFATLTNFGMLPTLAATGVLLAWHDGVRLNNLGDTAFGRVLMVKAVLVVIVFSLAGLHGMLARRFSPKGIRGLAIATLALSVVILGLAAALAMLPNP